MAKGSNGHHILSRNAENKYRADVKSRAMGNLSEEEFNDLPDGVKNLRVSAAGVALGGSPMEKFVAEMKELACSRFTRIGLHYWYDCN